MSTRRFIIVMVASATMLASVAAGVAVAGKGGGGGNGNRGSSSTSSLTLVLMDGATEARHNGRVTFDVSTSADQPFVGLRCWQGSSFVYDAYVGYYPGAWFDQWFVLDSDYWADGIAASCTARLFYYSRQGRERVLKTLDFPVAP